MPDAKSVASDCLKAWTNGDFDTARSLIHEQITFAGPFGTADGAEAYLAGLRRFRERAFGARRSAVPFRTTTRPASSTTSSLIRPQPGFLAPGGTSFATARSSPCARSSTHAP
jgi:hypothetical protein